MIRFNKFLSILSNNLEGFEVKYKDESTLMKIISYILFFNKAFLTSYITTIGKKVYWPSKEHLENRSEKGSMTTLAHEYQHAKDVEKHKIMFSLLYLFPQILAAPGVLLVFSSPIWGTLMAFGVISWAWWLLPFLLTLLFLVPLPAYWRRYYELRGYTMSLFVSNEFMKENGFSIENRRAVLEGQINSKNGQFTGSAYYFMWPFGVKDNLQKAIEEILSEDIYKRDPIYFEISNAIKVSK